VSTDKLVRLRQPTPCPICTKTSVQKYHPFCSSHCANVDLNRWLSGRYAVPMVEDDEYDQVDNDETGQQ